MTLAATLCVALSVLFDLGYLAALNLTFSEVPTSLADHARSAILWLPLAVAISPLSIVMSLFFTQIDARAELKAMERGEDISAYIQKSAKHAGRMLVIFTVVGFLIWLALGGRARWLLLLSAMTFWGLIVVYATPFDVLRSSFRNLIYFRVGLVVAPIFALSLYSGGYKSARAHIEPDQQLGMLTVRLAQSQNTLKANIIRSFERVVIVIDEHQNVLLFKPDDILRVEKAQSVSVNKGLLCDYWNIACPSVKPREP